jgi:hypothetical protein
MPRSQIGVLTFHRCINYGSYWQARALVEGLGRMGADAVVLDHRSARARRPEWRNAFQPMLPARTARSDYAAYAAKTRKFFAAFEGLPRSRPFPLEAPQEMDACDLVVVGSDEVWNFRHPWYAAQPAFFGEGLRAGRLVAYAASFGCHDAADGLDPCWTERLRRFSAVAVRDENSRRLVRESLGSEPALVLDPCLQFTETVRRPGRATGDVVVYGHSFPEPFAAAARGWAAARKLRLVSLGYRNDWADVQWLDAGPEDFAQAMGAARAVITNYFHGCVFALADERPFACVASGYRRHKLASLMAVADATERLIDPAGDAAKLARALDRPPGAAVQARLQALRERSRRYLDHALG